MFVMELVSRALASGSLRIAQVSKDVYALKTHFNGIVSTAATITNEEIYRIAEQTQLASGMSPEEFSRQMAAGSENIPLPSPKRPALTIVSRNEEIEPSAPRADLSVVS